MSDRVEQKEAALAATRDALAAIDSISLRGVNLEQSKTVLEVVDELESLEKQLANEVDQLREAADESL